MNSTLAFHFITGCNTKSFVSGHTKKTAWLSFKNHHQLLQALGKGDLTRTETKLFVSKLYKISDTVQLHLFAKQKCPGLRQLIHCVITLPDHGLEASL